MRTSSQRICIGASCSVRRNLENIVSDIRLHPLLFSSLLRKKGGRTPTDAQSNLRALRSAARAVRSALICRRSTAVLAQGSISSPGLSVRPGFLGLGLRGRYPPSPVPVQGCTSHPGHGAGRHDAQAARERTANPPAGTAPRPTFQLASERRPLSERDFAPVRSLAALSTTNEIAPGAFISN